MSVQFFSERAARARARILNPLLRTLGTHDAAHAGWGLPAGGVHLTGRRLILAGTPCGAPLFQPAMRCAAVATGADVVLAHNSLDPDALRPARFSVLVHMSRRSDLLDDMVLYADRVHRWWLVPSARGPFVALEKDGLRVDFEPPFVTFHERCQGVDAASAAMAGATRVLEAA